MVTLKEQPLGKDEIRSKFTFYEDTYKFRVINSPEDLLQAHQLRNKVFCEELEWVRGMKSGVEVDEYDEKAVPFGVFDKHGRLLAYIRLIPAPHTFMIEKTFRALVDSSYRIRKHCDAAETSRVCVASDSRNLTIVKNNDIFDISMLLFKGVYLWCVDNGIRYIYTVVEIKMLRYLRGKGFPCTLIGKPRTMPDGTRAAAVIMDWRAFEIGNLSRKPQVLEWFNQA